MRSRSTKAARDEADQRKLKSLRDALREGERSGFGKDFSFDKLNAKLDSEATRRGLSG